MYTYTKTVVLHLEIKSTQTICSKHVGFYILNVFSLDAQGPYRVQKQIVHKSSGEGIKLF